MYSSGAPGMQGVFDMSKIQIQKQITTTDPNHDFFDIGVFDMSKIQIQKQITTRPCGCHLPCQVCLICQRYKFKSKSQPRAEWGVDIRGVFDMSKIQIQKQITTVRFRFVINGMVCLICQRYKFKSKSQQMSLNVI